ANRRFILLAVFEDFITRHGAAWYVHLLFRDVDVAEELLIHEPVVALAVLPVDGVILVEIERDDVPEAQPFLAVHADKLPVNADRGGPGGQAEHGVSAFLGPGSDKIRYFSRTLQRRFLGVAKDDRAYLLELFFLSLGRHFGLEASTIPDPRKQTSENAKR